MALSDYVDELEPSVLILIAVVMIIVPEPATTTLGTGLLLYGLAWMAYEWNRP